MRDEDLGHFQDCEWLTKLPGENAFCECQARVGRAIFGMNCTMEPRRWRIQPAIPQKVGNAVQPT